MRTLASLCLVGIVLGLAGAAAASPCRWADSQGWPALRAEDRSVRFVRTYICPADAQGSLEIKYSTQTDNDQPRPLDAKSAEVKPFGKWERKRTVSEHISPYGTYGFCDEKLTRQPGAVASRRYDGKLQATYAVHVRAQVIGRGDMAPLSSSAETETYCPWCPHASTFLSLQDDRAMASAVQPGVRLHAEVELADWACLSLGGTLEARFFVGDSHDTLARAVRPDLAVLGLEKAFKSQMGRMILDVPVPVAALCKLKKPLVQLESGGRGELGQAGGGRSLYELKCK